MATRPHQGPRSLGSMKQSSPSQHSASEARHNVDHSVLTEKVQQKWRFMLILIALSVLTFISGIDATIITTSLPTITQEIGAAGDYTWVAQSYLFACTVPQPLYGQLANIFGRSKPLLIFIGLFALGSGIAGGAHSLATLIGGRIVQGLGTSGINVLPEIIICDLIPPNERGKYLSIMLSTAAVGSTIGPIMGGALAETNWRWIFWLNLPVSALCALSIFFLLGIRHQRGQPWQRMLLRVDFLGNAIFIPSMVALFYGLIMGGKHGYPWDSWRVIVPIILGVTGWLLFHAQQSSKFCREPSIPSRLFRHRTSAMAFVIIFLISIAIQATSYFLPIYFQAVKNVSPTMSGVYFLTFALALLPFSGISAAILAKTGQYKSLHLAGFALSAIGIGLFSTLDARSSHGEWIGFQIIGAAGAGFVFAVSLPSALAVLPEKDVATATSTFAFIRALGLVWGVTMSSIVFNAQVNQNLYRIDDTDVRQFLVDGAAYAFATSNKDSQFSIYKLGEPGRSQVVLLYEIALRTVWFVFVGVTGLGFLAAGAMQNIELRKSHDTEFGLTEMPTQGSTHISEAEKGSEQRPKKALPEVDL